VCAVLRSKKEERSSAMKCRGCAKTIRSSKGEDLSSQIENVVHQHRINDALGLIDGLKKHDRPKSEMLRDGLNQKIEVIRIKTNDSIKLCVIGNVWK
jgi:hypothetical protein